MKQDIKQVVTQRHGVKQVATQKLGLVEQELNQIVTQKLGLVEQEVNQIGTQKPGVAFRDLQEEDNETHSSFRAMCLLPQVYTVPYWQTNLPKNNQVFKVEASKPLVTSGNIW